MEILTAPPADLETVQEILSEAQTCLHSCSIQQSVGVSSHEAIALHIEPYKLLSFDFYLLTFDLQVVLSTQ
jgi:hypothetical protein